MSLPRLVATDLDGTLVRTDGTLSQYTHDVIAELDERGVPVVFVTGRPLRWAEEVFSYVGAHGLAVVSNGALVWDVARNEVDLVREVPVDVGLEVCRLIRDAVPGSTFAVETLAGIALETELPRTAPGARRQPARRSRRDLRRPGPQAAGPARGAAARRSSGTAPSPPWPTARW